MDTKTSPYAVASVGVGTLLGASIDDGENGGFLTYSGGLGVDFHS